MDNDLTATLSSALSGLQVGINNARAATREVEKLTTGSDAVRDTVRPLLELQNSEQNTTTASKIVKGDFGSLGRFVDETV